MVRVAAVLVATWVGACACHVPATRAAEAEGTDALLRLEAGVDAAEGVRAVKRLQLAYGHFLDAGQWADLGDLFTDDAIGEFPEGNVHGKAALQRRFMLLAGRNSAGLATGS